MAFKSKCVLMVVSVIATLMHSLSLQGASLKFDGYVSRDKQSLRITATVEGTTDEIGEEELSLAARLEVYILDVDTDKPVIIGSNNTQTADTNLNREFYLEHIDTPTSEEISTGRYKATYSIQVNNNTTGSATGEKTINDLLEEDGNIRTQLKFVRVDKTRVDSKEQELVLLTTVPNVAPSDFDVVAIHKGIRVNWKGNTNVDYTPNASQEVRSLRPKNVLVMVFPRIAADQLSLGAGLVNTATGEHTNIDCLFSYQEGNTTCITCPDNNGDFFIKTLQEDAVTQEARFKLSPNNVESGTAVISGLDLDTEYIALMQYEEGAQRTECRSVSPIETVSLTELNGEDDAVEGDPRCFIATAAYGSPFVREVRLFRWFRDTFLLPFEWGEILVEYYYRHSPKLVEPMSHSEALRSAVRFLLWPIAWILEFVKKIWDGDYDALLLLVGLGGVLFGVMLRLRYRLNLPSNQ